MTNSLFVYGTLMFPEIQRALLGKELESEEALLSGFNLCTIKRGKLESEYPFLKPSVNESVSGYILHSLNDYDMQVLSFYEGDEYQLSEIEVIVGNSLKAVKIFMTSNSQNIIFGNHWKVDVFRKQHLSNYLAEVIPDVLSEFIYRDASSR